MRQIICKNAVNNIVNYIILPEMLEEPVALEKMLAIRIFESAILFSNNIWGSMRFEIELNSLKVKNLY